MAYSSAIKREPNSLVKLIIHEGGILKVQSGAAVTLDIPIEVEDGGKVIFEDHTLAWIDNIVLKKGGKIISDENGTELTKEVILIPAEGKTGKIILEAEAELTINNAVDNHLPTKPIALVGGVYLKSGPWCVNNSLISSNLTRFEVMNYSKVDLGKFKSDGYTTIKFNPGSEINLLAFNEINNHIAFDKGQVTEEIRGEFIVDGAIVKGFDATDRTYNCPASPAPYVLAQIVNQHNTSDFKRPENLALPPGCPFPPLHLNKINLKNSTFQNVTFKLINAIKEPIINCNFIIDGAKISVDYNILAPLPSTIVDVILPSTIDRIFLYGVPSAMIPNSSVLFDLSVMNSTFKNNASMVMEWLTWDNKSIPNSSDQDYNYYMDYLSEFSKRLNGISVSNLENVDINGIYVAPQISDFTYLSDKENYDFVGLNNAINTSNCRTVKISNRKFLNCRIGQADQNSSVKLCKNFSFRVNSLNSLNASKRWATYDNDLRQSNKAVNLLGMTSGQDYRGNSIYDFYNGFNIENGYAFLSSQPIYPLGLERIRVLGRDYLEIPDNTDFLNPNLNDFINNIEANPFTSSSLGKFYVPKRSDIFLYKSGADVFIDGGFNNMSEFTNNHIFYDADGTFPSTKSINLDFNNWKPSGAPRLSVNIVPTGSYFTNSLNILNGCDDIIVDGHKDDRRTACSFFVNRNSGQWANLGSADTVLDNDFYAYLNDFCNGILSCDCYRQRLFDLMHLAVLGDSVNEKLQMVIDCITDKNSDPVYSYLNCDATNLLLLLGEAYERTGLIDDAVNTYLNILTNSANPADTMLARWRLMNLEAFQTDSTYGFVYDSLMADYYIRVDHDVTSTVHSSAPPPPPAIMQGNDNNRDEPSSEQQIIDNSINSDEKKKNIIAVQNPNFNQNPNESDEIATLEQNTPNPFTNETVIVFHLNREADVRLGIHNALGHTIKEVVNQRLRKGKYVYTFQNENNASGVYLYLFTTDGKQIVKKMQLVK